MAIARQLAEQRMRIVICARSQEELTSAANELRGRAEVHTFVCDVTKPDEIALMIAAVSEKVGFIEVLVNNAGMISVGPLETLDTAALQKSMEVNFWSAVHTTMAVIPAMKSRGQGRIVNVSSIGGKIPVPHLAAYCTSKFALTGYSAALRVELAKDGIFVTTVFPGLIRTGSARHAIVRGNHREEYAWFALSDGLPGLSLHADSAARQIVDAMIHGRAEATLGLPAKVAAVLQGIAPNLTEEITAVANQLLPASSDASARTGAESESFITRSVLGYFNHRAERQYNERRESR